MATFFGAHGATPKFAAPDFAYPREVIKKANANLASGLDPLRCLLEICTAERAIDPDTVFTLPALVEKHIATSPDDATRAMLTAYEANIYASIYSDNQWKYNQVDAPLLPLPDDIAKWSAAQFAYKINELYTRALTLARADNKALSTFAEAVEQNEKTDIYLPDIYSFILYNKIEDLNNFRYTAYKDNTLTDDCAVAAASYPAGSPQAIFWQCKKISLGQSRDRGEALLNLYKANIGKEGAPFALAEAIETNNIIKNPITEGEADNAKAIGERDKMIVLLKEAISTYPEFYRKTVFENALRELTNPVLTYKVANMTAPNAALRVTFTYAFTKSVSFGLYKLPLTDTALNGQKISQQMPAIDKKTVATTATDGTDSVTFTIVEPGNYAIVPMIDGSVFKTTDATRILCTPFVPVNVNGCTSNVLVAADFTSGAPLQGVTVDFMKSVRNGKYNKAYLGKTDKNGMLPYVAPSTNGYWGNYLQFTYKGQLYNFDENLRAYTFEEETARQAEYRANILTDRNLYHPGDTIEWAVALAGNESGVPATMGNKALRVVLCNANNQRVDTVDVTTDHLGRAYGSFATDKGVLTGYWTIRLSDADGSRSFGSKSVMVSDFKLPTFEAEFTKVERDVPSAGAVRLTGKATTYAGMPVMGASVKVSITGAQRWRWFVADGRQLADYTVATDAAGVFTVDIPAEILAKTNIDGKHYDNFEATAIVTSATAETSECNRYFTTGKPYVLGCTLPSQTVDTSEPINVTFNAYNADGDNKPIPMSWRILDSGHSVVLTGEAKGSETQAIDLTRLEAGVYTIALAPADSAMADNDNNATAFTAYNLKHNLVPPGEILFVPCDKFTVTGNKAEVHVGTTLNDVYVYSTMQLANNALAFSPRKISRGFAKLKFELPDTCEQAKVIIFTVRDGKVLNHTVTLSRPVEKAPEIIAESFRDKLVPGTSETWRFRLVNGKGNGIPDAAMVATIYNKALDQIMDGQFHTLFNFSKRSASMSLNIMNLFTSSDIENAPYTRLGVARYTWPKYYFWTMDAFSTVYTLRGNGMARAEAKQTVESIVADYAATAGNTEESITMETADEAEDGYSSHEDNFAYRPSETLQALWQPSLLTDSVGNVDIVFTVPDANTTWQFKAAAWTEDLRTTTFAAEAIANKPVMVQANTPRFLRSGDKAEILATVYNNTDTTAFISTVIEIFDIATGKVTGRKKYDNTVEASASAIVAMPIEAAADAVAIGYRVKSTANGFADGEQTAIPVLSAASTVIESTEFYLNPNDSKPFTVTVDASKDASVTLQYCQNPVWTIIKAMRGIAGRNESTSAGIAGRLFSALTAAYIVDHNTAVAQAIKNWKDDPGERALESMLSKNEDLKRLLLDQTPWVQAAADNSSRMAALADLLDPDKAATEIVSLTNALSKMQGSDGGFKWGGWSNVSSEWTTRSVLITLGLARSLGMLPDSDKGISSMMQSAYTYVEREATKPNRSTTDNELALIASLWPDMRTTLSGDKLIRNTVSSIANSWRRDNVAAKAYDVIILASNGRKAEAAKVLASIRQFGVVKADMGLCFPSVNDIRAYATIIQAYKTMDAQAREIDAMRQWVIVQAQANDDLGAYNPDYVIAAVMLTGSDWTSAKVDNNVTVNGQPLAIGDMESASGYFAQRIDRTGKIKITVTPNGVTPSYGSVVTIDSKPMETVEARPGRDLAIEKRVLVERDGAWVDTDTFKLGERVRVQLTITAKRNLEYVSIDDERPACFEPVDQLPGFIYEGGLGFYRENLDASTRLFISYMPQGTYHVTYDMTTSLAGGFISGIATLQSQYAPELTAHSGAARIAVR